MSSILPTPSDDYKAPVDLELSRQVWDGVFGSIGARLRAIEALTVAWQALVDAGTSEALEAIAVNIGPQIAALQAELAGMLAQIALAEDQLQALQQGGVAGANVTIAPIEGLDAQIGNVQAALGVIVELLGEHGSDIDQLVVDLDEKTALATLPQAQAGTGTGLMTASRTAAAISAQVAPSFEKRLFHVRDEKAQGTRGGATIVGWNARDLNTVLTNEISATLSSNAITLEPGTYFIDVDAPCFRIGNTRLRLYNVSDAAEIMRGHSAQSADASSSEMQFLRMTGRFLIQGAAKVVRVEHYASVAQATYALGNFSNIGTEVYTDCRIWKVA